MRNPRKPLKLRWNEPSLLLSDEVFDGWLNPKIPGNPWNMAEKLLLDPRVDGFFYWSIKGTPHYGRFTEIRSAGPNSAYVDVTEYLGLESTVSVTFQKQGEGTRMTLVHSGLPDTDGGRSHDKGWNYFLDTFPQQFTDASREEKQFR